jgi:hypothetical protein
MTIFNKDGKVYVLREPNPLVKTQENWDKKALVFHNFEWDDIKFKNAAPAFDPKKPKEEKKESEKQVRPEPVKKQEPIIQEETEEKEQTQESQDRIFDLPHLKYKVLSYCLPARIEKRKDSLYGEEWTRVKYDQKIIFPCIIIDSSDFSFEFWTSDPEQKITEKSIIYPFSYEVHNTSTNSYDKVPYDEYRWWKVSEKEQKEGGWLFRSIPSDTQPDFSN